MAFTLIPWYENAPLHAFDLVARVYAHLAVPLAPTRRHVPLGAPVRIVSAPQRFLITGITEFGFAVTIIIAERTPWTSDIPGMTFFITGTFYTLALTRALYILVLICLAIAVIVDSITDLVLRPTSVAHPFALDTYHVALTTQSLVGIFRLGMGAGLAAYQVFIG
jgi:hypothetical protein